MANDGAHILIVDDDERMRALLGRFLANNGFLVTQAESAEDAAAKMAVMHFDLLVLDVMMPGQDGFSFAAALRAKGEGVPIILLTARSETEDRISGLQSGADDYLTKPFEPRELVLRIQAILKRSSRPEPEQQIREVRFGDYLFDTLKGELSRQGEIVPLTTGEAGLMRILCRKPGSTVSRAALADGSSGGESRAVDVQITRLRRKIEDDPRNPRYLQTVWGEGYVLWTD